MKTKLRKGFTLVELVVVMILMGLITTAVVMVLRPAQNTFQNVTNKAYEEQTALIITDFINDELRYSTGVKVICNDGTQPGADSYYKNYIKLSNDYRETSKKKARGDFEKGRIEGTTFKALNGSITSSIFDEYDFQFSIVGFNSKQGEENLTIGVSAMAMRTNVPDQEAVAESIGKPNPGFVPYFDKEYSFQETFEFINLRNKEQINRQTKGLSVETYDYGTPVEGLGNEYVDFYDPRDGKDNTIWILYTHATEAPELSTAAAAGTLSSGGTPGGSSGTSTGGSTGGATETVNTGALQNSTSQGTTTTYGTLKIKIVGDNTNEYYDKVVYTATGGTTTNTQTTYEVAGNGDFENIDYTFNSANGKVTFIYYKDGDVVKEFTIDASTMANSEDKTYYIYNGDKYETEDLAKEERENFNDPNNVTYGTVTFKIYGVDSSKVTPSVSSYSIFYNQGVDVVGTADTVLSSSDSATVTFSVKDNTASFYFDAVDGNRVDFNAAGLKNRANKYYYIYDGKSYNSEVDAQNAKTAAESASSSGSSTYGTYTIHVIGATGFSGEYNFNVSNATGSDASKNVSAASDGTYSFTTDKDYMDGTINYNWGKLVDVKAADIANGINKDIWLYKGSLYNDEASAQAAKTADETPAGGGSGDSGSGGGDSTGGSGGSGGDALSADPNSYKLYRTLNITDANKVLYVNYYGYKITVIDAGTGTELHSGTHNQAHISLSSYVGKSMTLVFKLEYLGYDGDGKIEFRSAEWTDSSDTYSLSSAKDNSKKGTVVEF